MPLRVVCPEGCRFTAPTRQAGRQVRCPRCRTVLKIPEIDGALEPNGERMIILKAERVGDSQPEVAPPRAGEKTATPPVPPPPPAASKLPASPANKPPVAKGTPAASDSKAPRSQPVPPPPPLPPSAKPRPSLTTGEPAPKKSPSPSKPIPKPAEKPTAAKTSNTAPLNTAPSKTSPLTTARAPSKETPAPSAEPPSAEIEFVSSTAIVKDIPAAVEPQSLTAPAIETSNETSVSSPPSLVIEPAASVPQESAIVFLEPAPAAAQEVLIIDEPLAKAPAETPVVETPIESVVEPEQAAIPSPLQDSQSSLPVIVVAPSAKEIPAASLESAAMVQVNIQTDALTLDTERMMAFEQRRHQGVFEKARKSVCRVIAFCILLIGAANFLLGAWQSGWLTNPATAQLQSWAVVLMFLGALHAAYAAFLAQIADWSAHWVAAAFLLIVAAISAACAVVLGIAPAEHTVIRWLELPRLLQLKGAIWSICMVLMTASLAWWCGREALYWRLIMARLHPQSSQEPEPLHA